MNARSCFTVITVLVLGLMLVSCGSSYRQVEIAAPSDVKDKIENATPRKDYAFYVLETASPKQIEDLTNMPLLVCGSIDLERTVGLLSSSEDTLKAPLFKSENDYYIRDNVGCQAKDTPCMSLKRTFKVAGVDFSENGYIYGKDTSTRMLSAKCAELMQQDPKTVLLVKRDGIKPQGKVVQMVFK